MCEDKCNLPQRFFYTNSLEGGINSRCLIHDVDEGLRDGGEVAQFVVEC